MKFYKNKRIANFEVSLKKETNKNLRIVNKNETGSLTGNLKFNEDFFYKKSSLFFKAHSDSRNFIGSLKLSVKSLISGYFAELKLVGLEDKNIILFGKHAAELNA
eukprot:gene8-12_t